jgi:hypothetical protein
MISTFEVRLLDRDKPVKVDVTQATAEAVARAAATYVLKVKPASLDLFAIKSGLFNHDDFIGIWRLQEIIFLLLFLLQYNLPKSYF